MIRKVWIINFFLCGLAFVLIWGVYVSWVEDLPDEVPTSAYDQPIRNLSVPSRKNSMRQIEPFSFFEEVALRNLFSPDRKEVPPPTPPEEKPEKKIEPEPVRFSGRNIGLHGVVKANHLKKALIDNPESGGDGRSRYIWVQEGDQVEGVVVSLIESERILLEREGKVYQIPLYEKEKNSSFIMQVKEASSSTPVPSVIQAGTTTGTASESPSENPKLKEKPASNAGDETRKSPFKGGEIPLP